MTPSAFRMQSSMSKMPTRSTVCMTSMDRPAATPSARAFFQVMHRCHALDGQTGRDAERQSLFPGHVPVEQRCKQADGYEQRDVSDQIDAGDDPAIISEQIWPDGLERHEIRSVTGVRARKIQDQ